MGLFSRFSHPKKKNTPKVQSPEIQARPLRFAQVMDRRKRRRRVFAVMSLFVVLVLLILGLLLLNNFFRVRHVICNAQGQNCDSVLMNLAEGLLYKSMFGKLSLSHAFLTVKLTRIWPNTVRVQFEKPSLLLTFSPSREGNVPFSLTQSGVIVSFVMDNSTLPPIHDESLESKRTGDRVDPKDMSFYKVLIATLSKLNLAQIKEVDVVDDDTVVLKLDSDTIAYADKTEIGSELLNLQTLLLSSTLDRRGKTIDLRFENPVVK